MGKGVLKQTKLHTRCEVNVRSLLPLDRVLVFFKYSTYNNPLRKSIQFILKAPGSATS
jgi:hypothetical protein